MSVTDDLLRNNEAYAETFDKGDLPLPPAKQVAVVACMDARLDVHGLLGLELGDAHVIRNAGGVVTDDEIRSLAISQRLLGTDGDRADPPHRLRHAHVHRRRLPRRHPGRHRDQAAVVAESFTDLDADVRSSIGRIKASPFIPHKDVRARLRLRRPHRQAARGHAGLGVARACAAGPRPAACARSSRAAAAAAPGSRLERLISPSRAGPRLGLEPQRGGQLDQARLDARSRG